MQDVFHVERGQDVLDEDASLDGAVPQAELLLCPVENIGPEFGFIGAFELAQVKEWAAPVEKHLTFILAHFKDQTFLLLISKQLIPMFNRWHCPIFFPQPQATTGTRTHVSRVEPTLDLMKVALPTELPRSGKPYF